MDDLISRQAALNSVDTWDKFGCAPDGKLVRYDDNNHYVPYVRYDDIVHAIKHLPSVQPEPQWIPFTKRELTAEEQEEHPEWCYIMECPLPDDGQEILVSDGRRVWQDEFYVDDDGCYLDSDSDFDGCAWMPKPEPYKEGEDE